MAGAAPRRWQTSTVDENPIKGPDLQMIAHFSCTNEVGLEGATNT